MSTTRQKRVSRDIADMKKLAQLRTEIRDLKSQVAKLRRELSFLKTSPNFLQGLKGEVLTAKVAGGKKTAHFAERYDVHIGESIKVEVKFSKLNTPVKSSPTRRWNWSKPLGYRDQGKVYDFLLLVGDKDNRYPRQYLDDSPYVYFLIPRRNVRSIMTKGRIMGANVQLTTNLVNARSKASEAIKKHMVAERDIRFLLRSS